MKILNTNKGKIAILNNNNLIINNAQDFLDIMANANCGTIVLNKENFLPTFYDLKTGLAGEILQKVSNYRKRLVILGDFENIVSESLKAFIIESNRRGQVIFAKDLEKAEVLLK